LAGKQDKQKGPPARARGPFEQALSELHIAGFRSGLVIRSCRGGFHFRATEATDGIRPCARKDCDFGGGHLLRLVVLAFVLQPGGLSVNEDMVL